MAHDEPFLTYFAYGSNMLTRQLAKRTGGCTFRDVVTLAGHQLRFHKRSKDGSGKANAYRTGRDADKVIGVVFTVPQSGKAGLDRAEGLGKGYNETTVRVSLRSGEEIEAFTYVSDVTSIDVHLRPTTDYKNAVLEGAVEHGLPKAYIERFIKSVPTHKGRTVVRQLAARKGGS